MPDNIDYDSLKKRGFLRQKQDGFFVLRAKMPHAVFEVRQINKLADISQRFAKGFLHVTTRQGLEMPYIKFEDIENVEKELKGAGIETGASGPRLRTTTTCPGNNWCKSGLINTFLLYDRIENELGIRCAMDLPHKFKIAISGCPNACTRAQHSEIGVHGAVNGYVIYLGGCGGRSPQPGFKLDKIFTEDEALSQIGRVIKFYKEHAKPRQRLALLIEEFGKDKFLKEIY